MHLCHCKAKFSGCATFSGFDPKCGSALVSSMISSPRANATGTRKSIFWPAALVAAAGRISGSALPRRNSDTASADALPKRWQPKVPDDKVLDDKKRRPSRWPTTRWHDVYESLERDLPMRSRRRFALCLQEFFHRCVTAPGERVCCEQRACFVLFGLMIAAVILFKREQIGNISMELFVHRRRSKAQQI
jgi:hypothetical protein